MRRAVPSTSSNSCAAALARATVAIVLCAITIGCTPPPDLSDHLRQTDSTAPWPKLLSSAQLARHSTALATQTSTYASSTADLSARAAALRARAARMAGPVLDNATRRRLQAATARRN